MLCISALKSGPFVKCKKVLLWAIFLPRDVGKETKEVCELMVIAKHQDASVWSGFLQRKKMMILGRYHLMVKDLQDYMKFVNCDRSLRLDVHGELQN